MHLPDGLYDKLLTESVARLIADLRDPSCCTLTPLPKEAASERIAEALSKQLTFLLEELEGDGVPKAKRQIALVNTLLRHLRQQTQQDDVDPLVEPPQILHAVHRTGVPPEVPDTGLDIPW